MRSFEFGNMNFSRALIIYINVYSKPKIGYMSAISNLAKNKCINLK